MLPDFNRLRVFFYVHAEGSVTAAARRLHVSQSAVSQSLAKLEAEVGAQLFVRRHRELVPTPAAATLVGIVAPFVDELRGGLDHIHQRQREFVGTLRVGAPVEFGVHRLVPAFAEFRRAHPAVEFELRLGHPSEVVPLVQDGRLDLGFADVFDATQWTGLDIVEVMEESLVMVGSRRYERSVLGGLRTFAAASQAAFIGYHPRAPAIHGWFRHHFSKAPTRLELAVTAESVQAVVAAVRNGMGLGLVPAQAVESEPERRRLVSITTRRRPMTHRISMVRLLDRIPSRLEQRFAGFVRERSWA